MLVDSRPMSLTVRARISRPYYKETYMPNRQRLLELALKGLEAERAKTDDEIVQIKSQLNPRSTTAQTVTAVSPTAVPSKKRRMSAAARRRISEGMKRRYAEMRKAGQPTQSRRVVWSESKFERKTDWWKPLDCGWPQKAV